MKSLPKESAEADEFYHAISPLTAANKEALNENRPPGLRRFALEQAVLQLRHSPNGSERRSRPPEAAAGTARAHGGRNAEWKHLFNRDIISMPDKWEYPWFAVWDLACPHGAVLESDPLIAKKQLELFLREWGLPRMASSRPTSSPLAT